LKKILIYSGGVLLFFGIVFLLVYFNLSEINLFVEENVAKGGYPAVFILTFLVEIIEQPIGPEIPGLAGILLGLSVFKIFWVVVLGSVLGSFFSFALGKFLFRSRVEDLCKKNPKRKKYCKLFRQHSRWALFIASITPVPYVLFCWLSGAVNMKVKTFVFYGIIPRFFRILFLLHLIDFIF
jgi:membrane protein YqaA with SNARE-associated domain